jgi:hypothetical protein
MPNTRSFVCRVSGPFQRDASPTSLAVAQRLPLRFLLPFVAKRVLSRTRSCFDAIVASAAQRSSRCWWARRATPWTAAANSSASSCVRLRSWLRVSFVAQSCLDFVCSKCCCPCVWEERPLLRAATVLRGHGVYAVCLLIVALPVCFMLRRCCGDAPIVS